MYAGQRCKKDPVFFLCILCALSRALSQKETWINCSLCLRKGNIPQGPGSELLPAVVVIKKAPCFESMVFWSVVYHTGPGDNYSTLETLYLIAHGEYHSDWNLSNSVGTSGNSKYPSVGCKFPLYWNNNCVLEWTNRDIWLVMNLDMVRWLALPGRIYSKRPLTAAMLLPSWQSQGVV